MVRFGELSRGFAVEGVETSPWRSQKAKVETEYILWLNPVTVTVAMKDLRRCMCAFMSVSGSGSGSGSGSVSGSVSAQSCYCRGTWALGPKRNPCN